MARAHFREVVQDQAGNVIAGALVTVYNAGTVTPITQTMYATDSVADVVPLANPLTTDGNGVVSFYVSLPQNVDLTIAKTGYTTQQLQSLAVGPGSQIGTFTSATLAIGGTGIRGTSTVPAAVDHTHTMPTFGSPSAISVGATADGVAATIARSDHQHGKLPVTMNLVTNSVSNSAVLNTLVAMTVPANNFQLGSVLRMQFWGEVFNNTGGPLNLDLALNWTSSEAGWTGLSIPTNGSSRIYNFDFTGGAIAGNIVSGVVKGVIGGASQNQDLIDTTFPAVINPWVLTSSKIIRIFATMASANALFRVSHYGAAIWVQ